MRQVIDIFVHSTLNQDSGQKIRVVTVIDQATETTIPKDMELPAKLADINAAFMTQ